MGAFSFSKLKTQLLSFQQTYHKLNETKNLTKVILPLIKPVLLSLIVSYLIMLVEIGVSLLIPKYTGDIIDIVTRSKDQSELQDLCIKIFVVKLSSYYIERFSGVVKTKTFAALDHQLKSETYKRLLQCDMEYFDQKTYSDLRKVLNGGIHGIIKAWFGRSKAFIQAFGSLGASLYVMYQTYPPLMALAIVVIFLKLFLPNFGLKRDKKDSRMLKELSRKVYDTPIQAIENILLVKTFSTEAKEHKEFLEASDGLDAYGIKREKMDWIYETVSSLIDSVLETSLIWYGGILIFQGKITVGELSTFNIYVSTFQQAMYIFQGQIRHLKRTENLGSMLEFLQIVLKTEAKMPKVFTKENLQGDIEIKNVSFSYITKPDIEVLSNISLSIKKGQSVAIVGANGSGKTTLSYLLQGLYSPKQGVINIDGEDVQIYNPKWLRSRMGYVSQEPVLLDKTIEKNLVYGLHGEYTEEQISKALTLANARFVLDFNKFPDGLQTNLGRGRGRRTRGRTDEEEEKNRVKLSGGQRQRIAIARAFIKDPKILILDEPTSALDGESESKVQKAIDELMGLGDRTVIVIAHRLSTIINCDKIVVMDEGKIVEEGNHKELFAKKEGVYRRLFEFQINSMRNA